MTSELSSLVSLLSRPCLIGLEIIFALILGGVVVYFTFDTIRSFYREVSAPHPWAQLAQRYQLDFEYKSRFLGLFTDGPKMKGIYKGHRLKVEVFNGKHPETVLNISTDSGITAISSMDAPAKSSLASTDLIQLLAPHGLVGTQQGKISFDLQTCTVIYRKESIEPEVSYLKSILDLSCDLVEGCPRVIALGGLAVPALTELANKAGILSYVALQCLYYISWETWQRLGKGVDEVLCLDCLVRLVELPIHLSRWQQANYFGQEAWQQFRAIDVLRSNTLIYTAKIPVPPSWWQQPTYFGCRQCGQSTQFLETEGRCIVAILDTAVTERIIEGEQIRVNWFNHPQPFDFDEVEIIRADDEMVERFAVQLGNDTDPVRRPRYRQMTCRVAGDCNLSENTWRVLGSIFGRVS